MRGSRITTRSTCGTEEVLIELKKKDDDVYKWARNQPGLFLRIDESTQKVVAGILSNHPRLVDARKTRSTADPFVIAVAQVDGLTVVSGEIPSNNLRKPKIPYVCSALGIKHIRLLELLGLEGWKFYNGARLFPACEAVEGVEPGSPADAEAGRDRQPGRDLTLSSVRGY